MTSAPPNHEAHVALHRGETRADFARMAGEFYGVVVTVFPTIHGPLAVVLFADPRNCQEFRCCRAQTTLEAACR